MFDYSDTKDRADSDQAKVPIFEPLICKIRVGLRKSQYYANPSEEKELTSITGEKLNPQLERLYCHRVETRDKDIRSLIRYNDITKGYNHKNKISILAAEMDSPKSELVKIKELKTDIKIMIELIQEANVQIHMRNFYSENKNRGIEFLEEMLFGLTSKSYTFLDKVWVSFGTIFPTYSVYLVYILCEYKLYKSLKFILKFYLASIFIHEVRRIDSC